MAKRPKITKSGLEIDLTGVEASERRRKQRIPEGVYHAKVREVGPHKFNTGSKGVQWVFEITDAGKGKGARFWYNNALVDADGEVMEQALWSLRGVLQALEPRIKIPDKMMKIPYDKVEGRTVALEIGDDEYEEKVRSTIIDVFHPSLIEDEDEDVEDEDEEEDEEDWEEEDEEDEDEEEEEDEEEAEEWDLDEDEL